MLARIIHSRFFSKLGDVEQVTLFGPEAGRRAEIGELVFRRAAQTQHADAVLVERVEQLLGARAIGIGAVQVIAQHEQERFVPDHLAGGIDGVAQPFLGALDAELDLLADVQQVAGVVLEVARQLVVVLDRHLDVEECLEIG